MIVTNKEPVPVIHQIVLQFTDEERTILKKGFGTNRSIAKLVFPGDDPKSQQLGDLFSQIYQAL